MSNKPGARLTRNAIVVFLLLLLSGVVGGIASAQSATLLWPIIFSGNVTVGGQPAADGLVIVARMGVVESGRVTTQGGRYVALSVGTQDKSLVGSIITFHLNELVAQRYLPALPTPAPGTKLVYSATSGEVKMARQ